MAKQTRIPGTFDPEDQQVQEAAEDYVSLLTARMKMQERENVAREALLKLMVDRDIMECEVNGYQVKRLHTELDKIRIKKIVAEEPIVE